MVSVALVLVGALLASASPVAAVSGTSPGSGSNQEDARAAARRTLIERAMCG